MKYPSYPVGVERLEALGERVAAGNDLARGVPILIGLPLAPRDSGAPE